MTKKWWALGQDYKYEAAARQQLMVREAIGDVCRVRHLTNGMWRLEIFE